MTNPSYGYYPANTDIDYYGLDPYPVQTVFSSSSGSTDLAVIPAAIGEATSLGISISQIIPVYQAFSGGGYAQWIVPTAAQEWQILQTWQQYTPTPFFDYAIRGVRKRATRRWSTIPPYRACLQFIMTCRLTRFLNPAHWLCLGLALSRLASRGAAASRVEHWRKNSAEAEYHESGLLRRVRSLSMLLTSRPER